MKDFEALRTAARRVIDSLLNDLSPTEPLPGWLAGLVGARPSLGAVAMLVKAVSAQHPQQLRSLVAAFCSNLDGSPGVREELEYISKLENAVGNADVRVLLRTMLEERGDADLPMVGRLLGSSDPVSPDLHRALCSVLARRQDLGGPAVLELLSAKAMANLLPVMSEGPRAYLWDVSSLSAQECDQGDHFKSLFFRIGSMHGFQLHFFPQGFKKAQQGHCSIYLLAPHGCEVTCDLRVDDVSRTLTHSFRKSNSDRGFSNFGSSQSSYSTIEAKFAKLEVGGTDMLQGDIEQHRGVCHQLVLDWVAQKASERRVELLTALHHALSAAPLTSRATLLQLVLKMLQNTMNVSAGGFLSLLQPCVVPSSVSPSSANLLALAALDWAVEHLGTVLLSPGWLQLDAPKVSLVTWTALARGVSKDTLAEGVVSWAQAGTTKGREALMRLLSLRPHGDEADTNEDKVTICVASAGEAAVKGLYKAAGTHDGVWQYQNESGITLLRYRFPTSGKAYWFFSIRDSQGRAAQDVDFYRSFNDSEESAPSMQISWIAKSGQLPLPVLRLKESHTNSRTWRDFLGTTTRKYFLAQGDDAAQELVEAILAGTFKAGSDEHVEAASGPFKVGSVGSDEHFSAASVENACALFAKEGRQPKRCREEEIEALQEAAAWWGRQRLKRLRTSAAWQGLGADCFAAVMRGGEPPHEPSVELEAAAAAWVGAAPLPHILAALHRIGQSVEPAVFERLVCGAFSKVISFQKPPAEELAQAWAAAGAAKAEAVAALARAEAAEAALARSRADSLDCKTAAAGVASKEEDWSCPTCTLVNAATASECSACGGLVGALGS